MKGVKLNKMKKIIVLAIATTLFNCGTSKVTMLTKIDEGVYKTTLGDTLTAKHRLTLSIEEGGCFRVYNKAGRITDVMLSKKCE